MPLCWLPSESWPSWTCQLGGSSDALDAANAVAVYAVVARMAPARTRKNDDSDSRRRRRVMPAGSPWIACSINVSFRPSIGHGHALDLVEDPDVGCRIR